MRVCERPCSCKQVIIPVRHLLAQTPPSLSSLSSGCRAAADDDDDVEDTGTVTDDLGAHADALRTDGEAVDR